MTMRTPKIEEEYRMAKELGNLIKLYDEEPVLDFKYWVIVKNRFIHDKLAKLNHMVVLRRECPDLRHIKVFEWVELLYIIWQIRDDYHTFNFNFPAMSSVTNIPHAHLYKLKKEYR